MAAAVVPMKPTRSEHDMKNSSSVDHARQVVADLVAKRDELDVHKAKLEHAREELAFDAHTGDDKAHSKLTKLNRELIELDAELASFTAAIRTAEHRVLQAQGIEHAEIDRKK